ncbi:Rieske 2Fe-2S domain-containing protein [Chloroflexota bacterium]
MQNRSEENQVSRRKFLKGVLGIASGAIGVTLAVPLIGYFLSPAWRKGKKLPVPIARIKDIPLNLPTYVTYEERINDGWHVTTLSKGAWIINKDNKDITVFDPRCTHLNCPYYWDKEAEIFLCPCHDGKFDIQGNVIGGPPPRSLDKIQIDIAEDTIFVG